MTHSNKNSAFNFQNYYSTQKFTVVINANTHIKFVVDKKPVSRKPAQTLAELDTAPTRLIHLRDGDVVLYRVSRSRSWQARFRTYANKWMRFSTGKRDVEDAKRYACEAFDEAKYRERLGFALMVKRFEEIAKYCCEDMRRDLAAGVGKKVYTAYIPTTQANPSSVQPPHATQASHTLVPQPPTALPLQKRITAQKKRV
jgi:hypothetical protein